MSRHRPGWRPDPWPTASSGLQIVFETADRMNLADFELVIDVSRWLSHRLCRHPVREKRRAFARQAYYRRWANSEHFSIMGRMVVAL